MPKGLTIYAYNVKTSKIYPKEGDGAPDEIYVQALNMKNAHRKVVKMLNQYINGKDQSKDTQ